MHAYAITQFLFVKNHSCALRNKGKHQNVSNQNSTSTTAKKTIRCPTSNSFTEKNINQISTMDCHQKNAHSYSK